MDEKLKALKASWQAKHDEATKALAENRNDDAAKALEDRDAVAKQIEDHQAELKRGDDLKSRLAAGHAWDTEPAGSALPFATGTGAKTSGRETIESVGDSEVEKYMATGPFKSMGHFAYACKQAGPRPGTAVHSGAIGQWYKGVAERHEKILNIATAKAMNEAERISTKATTGLNEFTDSEGGLLIPMQFSNGIWQRSLDEFNIMSVPGFNAIPVTGNNLRVKAYNDKSRADGSRWGGVAGYWTAEAAQYTSSKPTFRYIDLRLSKLTILVPATEELLEDVPALSSEITRCAGSEMAFKINDALIRGGGQDMPLGLLSAACKVTVATSGGGANTIKAADVDNMWMRRAAANGSSYVWLANQDIEGQIAQLNYSSTNTGAVWTYLPGGTFGSDMPKLKGKSVYYCEQCESLGTEGDLILFDPTQIACIVKSSGIKSAVSMHLRFDYDETLFKFSFRMDARPYWESSLTRFKGSNALSPIITFSSTRT